jgi:His/Glu/Gln/Arg/opine family amino acid ABC transporter permease subunit
VFEVLIQHHQLFLKGFGTTLSLLALIMLIGIPLGVLAGVLGSRYSKLVGKLVNGLKFLTKVIPVLVLLFWLHFPLQALLNVVIDPFWTTVIALGFVNAVAVAHIVQSDLELLPKSYREAGTTLGMTKKQIVQYVELPILAKRTSPSILLNQATMLEYTLFASLISVPELFRVAQSVNSMIYDPIAVYSLLVLFFVIILTPIHLLIAHLKKKYEMIYV